MRARLAYMALAITVLVVLAFIIPLALLVRNQAEDRALSAAERDAQALAAALALAAGQDPSATVTLATADAVLEALPRADTTIIFPDGAFRGATFVPGPNIDRARDRFAFTAETLGGAEVLVPVLIANAPASESVVIVRAFVGEDELRRGVVPAWLMLAGLGIFLIAVAVVAADRLGRAIVRPISELSDAARALGDGDLEVRVDPTGPEPIADVGEAFNFLANRLDALLRAERETVADMSHRLRTPLTALRLQAETLSNPEDSAALLSDIDQLEQAVDRLIADARRVGEGDDATRVADLASVVRHRATFWKVLADEQGRPIAVSATGGPLLVEMGPDELGGLIDRLVENVFMHTPPGSGFAIEARPSDHGKALLVVEDEGPGFADAGLVARGVSGAGSTGLGLDIALRSAIQAGGGLEILDRDGGGARVEVQLARVRSTADSHAGAQA